MSIECPLKGIESENDAHAMYLAYNQRMTKNAKWSDRVTRTSDALDLERGVFKWDDPHTIAMSLRRSAERSNRRKSTPYRSAMSMLTFYINRAGHNLPASRRRILENAKLELRRFYGRE